jgi:hypothetical protein
VSGATGDEGASDKDRGECDEDDDDAYLFSDGAYPIVDNYEVSRRSKFKMVFHLFELLLSFMLESTIYSYA